MNVSVIIATRDRPKEFRDALASIVNQSIGDLEIVVVNDGSADHYLDEYKAVLAELAGGRRLIVEYLPHRKNGHGQSYALNVGVGLASGDYVCFLDDDDEWSDLDYLNRAMRNIERRNAAGRSLVDLYMSNQVACLHGVLQPENMWLANLAGEVSSRGGSPADDGTFDISVNDLMTTSGFCHINCLMVRRELWQSTGGMDEGIRWECDHDIFLRLVDAAELMIHDPKVISKHNIPDPKKSASMTTSVSMLRKRLYQLNVCEKLALFAERAEIRSYARLLKGYTQKKISEELAEADQFSKALWYACQAMITLPSFKWMAYTTWLSVRFLFRRTLKV
ncbi:MAG: glycosyltransferase family 2 protein [Pseudomonadota bacterium]